MILPKSTSVLVAGAGPTGLATACTLRSNGVDVVVVDAAPEPSTSSRAIAVHARTLETMEGLGIIEDVLREGLIVKEGLIRSKDSVLGRISFDVLQTKYPMVLSLPQVQTERILKKRLEKLGGVVHRGVKVVEVQQDGEGVLVEVDVSGSLVAIRAQYVVAADGRGSILREQVGIAFEGGGYQHSFILADMKLLKTGPLEVNVSQEFLTPAGLLLCIPLPGDLWRIVATVDEARKDNDATVFQHLLDDRAGRGVKIDELVWQSRFRIEHGLASQYREGRVFLAGDAAHVHPPTGGQGMNIGIQDGCRLAQILSEAVWEGKSTASDLDRYQAERRPIAKGVVAFAHRFTVVNMLKSPVLRFVRDWLVWGLTKIPFVRYNMAYTMSGLGHGR